jgi:hypothetical protein
MAVQGRAQAPTLSTEFSHLTLCARMDADALSFEEFLLEDRSAKTKGFNQFDV